MITTEEIRLLRELAKQYGEIANDERQQNAIQRIPTT